MINADYRVIPIRFTGVPEREGSLTLGQINIFEWLERVSDSSTTNCGWQLDLPQYASVTDITETLSVLVQRYESLRTIYPGGKPATQRVLGSGVLNLEVYSVDECYEREKEEPNSATLIGELAQRLRGHQFDHAACLPLRVAVALKSGYVVAGYIMYSHLAVDFWSMEVVGKEFAEMVRKPSLRLLGPPSYQPLDQAQVECSPRERRRAAIALGYLASQLRLMPKFALPEIDSNGQPYAVELASKASAMAMHNIALRTRMTRPAILLAAICVVLSEYTGFKRLIFPIVSGNRLEARLGNYVGTLAQSTLFALNVDGESFDELIRQAYMATIVANRHGYYDVYRRLEITREIESERGTLFTFEPLFNCITSSSGFAQGKVMASDEIRSAVARTRLRKVEMHSISALLRFDALSLDELLNLRLWAGDASRIKSQVIESLLLGVERLLVSASSSDIDAARMRHVAEIEQAAHGSDWMLIDSCWITMTEVQHVLDDAFGGGSAQAAIDMNDNRIVAYIVARSGICRPEDAHIRCLKSLSGRTGAMTPHYYIICNRAPEDPTDVEGWKYQHVLAQGTGRLSDGTSDHAAAASRGL